MNPYTRGGVAEMMTFVYRDGRPEASKGAYDDRPMSYSIGWQMRKYAKFKVSKVGRGRPLGLREF